MSGNKPKPSVEEEILRLLKERPGLKARQIADRAGLERKVVNSLLYGKFRDKVWQDTQYRWYLKSQRQEEAGEPEAPAIADTPLAKLASYYLECLGRDALEIKVFAASNRGQPDYIELDSAPGYADRDPLASEAARALLGRLRHDRQMAPFIGFPVVLRWHEGKRGWRGGFVEPLFLYALEDRGHRAEATFDPNTFPIINTLAIRTLTGGSPADAVAEVHALEKDLGLNELDEPPELDELLHRLYQVRPEWPWKESAGLDELITTPPLAEVSDTGLYNRLVLLLANRPRFTAGLEAELRSLMRLAASNYGSTALGRWIDGAADDPLPEASEAAQEEVLLEVLPLNDEQRMAVRQALTQPMTVITGPPGTGKSQVVSNILINAAWRGMKVLFASKNNKAVDVVEIRVNALGPRPIVIRLGANQYQTRLAEYLLALLSATATPEDEEEYREALSSYSKLAQKFKKLDAETDRLLQLRNKIDRIDRSLADARDNKPCDIVQLTRETGQERLQSAVSEVAKAIQQATPDRQPLLTRLVWPAIRRRRFKLLAKAVKRNRQYLSKMGIELPALPKSDSDLKSWSSLAEDLQGVNDLIARVGQYLSALNTLKAQRTLEDIAKERMDLQRNLTHAADRVWKLWLRTQPLHLTSRDRKLIGQYAAVLKMVTDAHAGEELPGEIRRQYKRLLGEVAHLLPCWAVTSLSVRGRAPFNPGHYDLVVIDEASQCDIASALPLLYRTRRIAVIGDPKQLHHITSIPGAQDKRMLVRFGLERKYANWSYTYSSLFNLAASLADRQELVTLRDHFRSHADIIGFSNKTFYEGRLRIATPYTRLKIPPGESHAVRWVNVAGKAHRPPSGGAVNEQEARKVVDELRILLVERGYRGTVGVVSPFRMQASRIRELVNTDKELSERLAAADFLCDTVHSFQGDERDVMIFSPVIAQGITRGAVHFLRENGNLFNVAITRARAELIVIGDLSYISECDVEYLRMFANYVADICKKQSQEEDYLLSKLGPEYPQVSNPEQVSEWERIFYRELYKAGIRCLPQYAIEQYRLDLALIDGNRRLDIEVDGERYHKDYTGELCKRDQLRNQRLYELGWDVMRFWVYQIRDDLDGCVAKVMQWLNETDGGQDATVFTRMAKGPQREGGQARAK